MKDVVFVSSLSDPIFDLTQEILPFHVWETAHRMQQTAPYWPPGTIFASVVDPGVGIARKAEVLKTLPGHYFVSPIMALNIGCLKNGNRPGSAN